MPWKEVITPDCYTVDKKDPHHVFVTAISHKPVQLVNSARRRLREIPVTKETRIVPACPRTRVSALADYALKLEQHYRPPGY